MIEIITTVIISSSSVLLFAYWFRYTCLLILSARPARDFAGAVVTANQLHFTEVQSMLRGSSMPDLALLKDSLDRDYQVLRYLLKYSANAQTGEDAIEKRMLSIDYQLMRGWYSIAQRFSPAAACQALNEMSMVVAHFANAMGERSIAGSAA